MPSRPRLIVAVAVAVAALAVPAAASADGHCSRYAAPSGSDAAAGTEDAPLRTAQALADSLRAGETGCLRSGTYSDEVTGPYVVRFDHGGAAGAPIRLRSAPGERATLRGIVSFARGADHVTLSDVDVDGRRVGGSDAQISVHVTAADAVIERNRITNHRTASCLTLGVPGWGYAERPVVRGNTFRDCGDPANRMLDHAIYLNAVTGGHIVDNLVLGSGGYAVHFYGDARRTTVAHNVMDGNGGGVIFSGYESKTANDNVVEHNVIANSTVRPHVEAWWGGAVGAGNIARSNCVHGGRRGIDVSGGGFAVEGNVTADPGFAGGGDYRLAQGPCLAAVGYDTAAKLRGETVTAGAAAVPKPRADTAPGAQPAARRAASQGKARRQRCRAAKRSSRGRRSARASARCQAARRSARRAAARRS